MPHRPIPLVTALSDIYTEDALLREGVRWNDLFERFQKQFGTPVQKVSRAPGRVNIIGTSYSLSLFEAPRQERKRRGASSPPLSFRGDFFFLPLLSRGSEWIGLISG